MANFEISVTYLLIPLDKITEYKSRIHPHPLLSSNYQFETIQEGGREGEGERGREKSKKVKYSNKLKAKNNLEMHNSPPKDEQRGKI